MIIEVDFCVKGERERRGSTRSFIIWPGERREFEIGGGTVAITSAFDCDRGEILRGTKHLKALLYEGGNDNSGRVVGSKTITLTGKQIVLFSEPGRETRIYSPSSSR